MKFNVSKSTRIDAPVSNVRALVEDFNHWNSWSPWTVIEPSCPIEIEGDPKQEGHVMAWDGEIIGSGKNTLSAYSDNRLDYDLEFFKPWKSKAKVSFHFEDEGDQTRVTWTMQSNMPFFMFFMIKTTENMIGMDYDRGLSMLKELAEKGKFDCETIDNGLNGYQGFSYVGIERTVPFKDMPEAMPKDFDKIANDVVIKGDKAAKHWLTIYPKFDMKNLMVTYIAAISDEELEGLNLDASYTRGEIIDSTVLEIKHNGAYDFIGNAWAMGSMIVRAKKMKSKAYPFEQYWNSPHEVAPEELQSSVFFPVK